MTKLEQLKLDREQAIKRIMDQYSAMEATLLNSIENNFTITFDDQLKHTYIDVIVTDITTNTSATYTIWTNKFIATKFNNVLFNILNWVAGNIKKTVKLSTQQIVDNETEGAIITLASLQKERTSAYLTAEYKVMNKAIFDYKFVNDVTKLIPKELVNLIGLLAVKELR